MKYYLLIIKINVILFIEMEKIGREYEKNFKKH